MSYSSLRSFAILAILIIEAMSPYRVLAGAASRATYVAAANVPLVVLDQRGTISAQVQIGPRQDEILTIGRGRVNRVLARHLTTYGFGAGLSASPDGRLVIFSQTDAHVQGRTLHTRGLWLATRQGGAAHAFLTPPGQANSGEPFDTGAVAWSPDGHTLAYAVNLYTDTPVAPSLLAGTGLWLTRADGSQKRLVFALTSLQSARLPSIASCGSPSISVAISALSWMDAPTVAASVECANVAIPGRIVYTVLSVDTTTGSAHTIVAAGRDAAYAPATRRLAYVTGSTDGISSTTLWVADAQGRHARRLITARTLLSSPAWSPDGRSIAYITAARVGASLHTSIHTVDIVTGHSRTLLADDARGQPLLPSGGHFARLAWLPAPS